MTTARGAGTRERLCSVFSRANQEDPGGSAPSWARCVVMELATPWESDVSQTGHFPRMVAEVLDAAERRGLSTRLQCVEPDPDYSVEEHCRVVFFARPEGPFATYLKDEFVVPSGQEGPLVRALVAQPEELGRFDRYRQDTSQVRDILVCTHGTHDVCCATFGNSIYRTLRDQYARELDGSLRVWRVSHLGGHRFAPNLVDLPEGRFWCRMDQDALEPLVLRKGPVSDLKHYYRGWAGLDSPHEQVAEREIFMQEGWEWVQRSISGQEVERGDEKGNVQVRIDVAASGTGLAGTYEATVQPRSGAPRVACLSGEETPLAPQYAVSKLVLSHA